MHISKTEERKCAKIVVKTGEEVLHLTLLQNALEGVIPDLNSWSETRITDFLLLAENIELSYNPDTFVVSSIHMLRVG